MTMQNNNSMPLIGLKHNLNDDEHETNELGASDRQQTFASDRDTIYFPSSVGGEKLALHSEFDEKVSFLAPGAMTMQSVMSHSHQNTFPEYMETLNYDKKDEIACNANSSSTTISQVTSGKDSNNASLSPEDESQQCLEQDCDLFEFSFYVTRAVYKVNESSGKSDVFMDIDVAFWPKKSINDSMKISYKVKRWYQEMESNHSQLDLHELNLGFPSVETESLTDGSTLTSDMTSGIQEYLSGVANSMSNNEVHTVILSFFDDGSSSLISDLKIASLESRLLKTTSLCNDLNTRLRATEKNYSQISDLVSIMRYKFENFEAGNKSIHRVNSVSTTMISDDFQSTDSLSSSNPFHQRSQNHWNRNTSDTASPIMMNADGFKLKAYNKDPSFLNQPSAAPQQSGYWQDEPVLSNNNEFWDVFPHTSKSSVLDAQIEKLLSFIQPNATAEKGRNSIIFFLIQQIEMILGIQPENYFPTGEFAIKCYLPDESSQIAFFIYPEKQRNWVETVLYGLQQLSSQNNEMKSNSIHTLTDVTLHPYGDVLSIICLVDGQRVNILVNDVKRLREAAYLEHCNTLVAKQHLFKRSLILLKAWWRYESGIQSFSDMALPILILAIINKYHRILQSPLQVLSLFFQYYADFDWSERWVSIERIGYINAPSTERSEEGYSVHFSQEVPISRDIVDKYRSVAGKPAFSSLSSFGTPMLSNNFISSSINIVDPFSRENIVYGAGSEDILSTLSNTIRETAKKMTEVLVENKKVESSDSSSHDWLKECFESIFRKTLTHFRREPRHDCVHASRHIPVSHQYHITVDPFFVDHMQLCENLKNTRQILGNEVTTAMLVSLTESVLSEKGPLPVGEVGKMLQEATGNPHLSQMLKDKHNGLKKFLEKFPELFIMSNDHPFNPHVYLRSNFTIQEQRQLEAGSTEFLVAYKKAKKNRRKTKGAISYHVRGYN